MKESSTTTSGGARCRVGAGPAFTLVELLVVTAVGVVLASFLAVTALRIRESARATRELSQLRQVAGAGLQFVKENNDRLFEEDRPWVRQLIPHYLAEQSGVWHSPFDPRTVGLQPSPLSYGLNYNAAFLRLTRSDSIDKLYLFAPAIAKDGRYAGTLDNDVWIHNELPPPAGSFAKGKRITVAFGDGHAEHLELAEYLLPSDMKHWYMCIGDECVVRSPPGGKK